MGDMTGKSGVNANGDFVAATPFYGPGGCFPTGPLQVRQYPRKWAAGVGEDQLLSIKKCDNGYIVAAAENAFDDEEFGFSYPVDKTYVFDSENKLDAWVSKLL